MDKTCEFHESCGLDFCQPVIREHVECPHYRRKMKPILFNTPMTQAVKEDIKTFTRRVAFPKSDLRKFPYENNPDGWWFRGRAYSTWDDAMRSPQGVLSLCKYKKGDILYVRETFAETYTAGYLYAADFEEQHDPVPVGERIAVTRNMIKWRPSIHMPKEAARLFLRVKDIRVEPLNSMEEEDAIAEGFPDLGVDADSPLERFSVLWDKTIQRDQIGKYDWYSNPWVWVIEFEKISKEDLK